MNERYGLVERLETERMGKYQRSRCMEKYVDSHILTRDQMMMKNVIYLSDK